MNEIIQLFEKPYISIELRIPEELFSETEKRGLSISGTLRIALYAVLCAHAAGETDLKEIKRYARMKKNSDRRRITMRMPMNAHDHLSSIIAPMTVNSFLVGIASLCVENPWVLENV